VIDYSIFLEKRFDLVIRYHYFKKFNYNFKITSNFFKDYRWSSRKKSLFYDRKRWQHLNDILSKDFLKKHPYPITNKVIGKSSKRFVLSLYNNIHLYWTIKSDLSKIQLRKIKGFDKNNIRKWISKKEFNDIILTEQDVIKKMNDLNFFSEEYMI